jgi:beta-lactamase class A
MDFKFIRSAGALALLTTFLPAHSSQTIGILHTLQGIVSLSLHQANIGKSIDTESVYFIDLVHNKSFGFNENMEYTPASLLKLPAMIALLRTAEDNPAILSKRIIVDSSCNEGYIQNIPPDRSVQFGETYSIEQLITSTLRYSDNCAYGALIGYLKNTNFPAMLRQLYTDFHLDYGRIASAGSMISPKQYSTFLTALYSASYLDRQYSDKAIKMLSESKFAKGLKAGVSSEVVVAHKFGERGISGNDTLQLHDCGIVYDKTNPYILCIMTKGRSKTAQTILIHSISKAVFRAVKKGTL